MTSAERPQFVHLLARALDEPGVISRAYTAFHGYSIGNKLLALLQCAERGLPPGPIATFNGWRDKGRHVRSGETAIALWMPLTAAVRRREESADDTPHTKTPTLTRFVLGRRWFVLSQTDGAEVEAVTSPEWDRRTALLRLSIEEESFALTDGNCQGYARQRVISVSPIAVLPHKTRFHELAHVVLGHTEETTDGVSDASATPRSLREVEAEAVALLCLEALNLPGAEHCRGYIQHWNASRGGDPIPERSAQRIFKAADAILNAGTTSDSDVQGGAHD